jgi:uncharacterized membrane protein YsdA (DUF1294 family)/cold shock CspA family protein
MADPNRIRKSGLLADWNDERGFGFVVPGDGSRRVFAHISEFAREGPRPSDGDEVTFVVGEGDDGRRQGEQIEILRSARLAREELERATRAERGRARISWLAISVVPLFAVLFVLVATYWMMPLWAILLYPLMSVATFALYYVDKTAALQGRWRTRETTLQLAGLLGGWPGAVIAQQVLRHKNRKASFQAAFWCIVVLNVAILLVIVWYEGPMAKFFAELGQRLIGS